MPHITPLLRRIAPLIALLLACNHTLAAATDSLATDKKRPKVALVLSGGGAKGFAHIGVLKVLEQAGVPIDMVCGTSIGSLIGGLYALGYDAEALDSMVRAQEWGTLLSDKINWREQDLDERARMDKYFFSVPLASLSKHAFTQNGLIKGQNLANLFTRLTIGYHDSIDFNTLPIPFACVATDMVTFSEVDFHSGNLATAMRASMAIPAAFTPVRLDSMVLVDGGLRNNYPADIARQMGADYIIGVSLQKMKQTTTADLDAPGSVISRLIDVNCYNKYRENWDDTDIGIRVNTDGFGTASFNLKAIDTLEMRGYREARRHWQELISLRDRVLGTDSSRTNAADQPAQTSATPRKTRRRLPTQSAQSASLLPITATTFRNTTPSDERYLRRRFRLDSRDSLSTDQIEQMLTAMRGPLFYNDASYQLTGSKSGYRLTIDTEGKKASQVFIGVRFDNEEKVALGLCAVAQLPTKTPMQLALSGRLGKRSYGRIDLTLLPVHLNSFTLSYQYNRDEIDVYDRGDLSVNLKYHRHRAELALLNFTGRNYLIDLFARFEHYNVSSALSSDSIALKQYLDDIGMVSYHARVHYNSQDQTYFPTRGSRFEAAYGLHTTNLYQFKGKQPVGILAAAWQTNLRLGSRLTLRPTLYGRSIATDHSPYLLRNAIGGPWYGQFADQQMPMAGMNFVEIVGDHLAAAQLTLQHRLTTNNYLLLTAGAAQQADKMNKLASAATICGIAATYAYNSLVGPLSASLGYNNRARQLYFYANLGFQF